MRIAIQIALVIIGSSSGGLTRWGVGLVSARWLGTAYPWGTLCVNLAGCLFLGWFSTWVSDRIVFPAKTWIQAEELRLLLAVGFTGSLTTFSAFELETHTMLRTGDVLKAAVYVGASVT